MKTAAKTMWECSVAALLLLVMCANGDIEQHQSIRVFQKTGWENNKHGLQDELSGIWGSRSRHTTEENDVGEQPRLWTLRRIPRSTEDLQGVCSCLSRLSTPPPVCSSIEELGPIIVNGTCLNSIQRRRRRRGQPVQIEGNITFATPSFPALPWCAGNQTLLLVSSGEMPNLHLSNVPSVWVCPNSLSSSLHQLAITNVPEVKIAPGALTYRSTDFSLSLSGMSGKLVFSRGSLSAGINVGGSPNSLMESPEHRLPPQIKVDIEDADTVKFESKSVVAPRVWVEVRRTETLHIETEAFSSDISALHISSTRGLFMEPRAAVVNSLEITSISTTVLEKQSVVVMARRGEVILRDMSDVEAPEGAITLGGGATLEMSNVIFTDNSNRAVLSLSPLSSVVLRDVEVAGINSTSICLATQTLTLGGEMPELSEHSAASACLRFVRGVESNTTEVSGVVLCEVSSLDENVEPSICADQRCQSCRETVTEPTEGGQDIYLERSTEDGQDIYLERSTEDGQDVYLQPVTVDVAMAGNWWEEPKYLGLVIALPVLLALLLLIYCLYRRHRCSQRGAYELPQTYRNGTFPRTIITPDNLRNSPSCQSPHAALPNGASSELFVSYCASHGPSLQQAALLDQQNRDIGRSPPRLDNTWRESHQPATYQHHSSIMTPEDDYSLSSSEMTI